MGTDFATKEIDHVTIRFAGDSGDGMQLTGDQFTNTTAIMGNDISTFPDFPAEIRAPAGTLPGVSGFQVNFSSFDTRTPGDDVNVLVVMNPAALEVNVKDLVKGGLIIANSDTFTKSNLNKIGLTESPLENESLKDYQVIQIPLSKNVGIALQELGLKKNEVERCKNFYALGVVYWLYDRSMEPTVKWIESKFAKRPDYIEANITALKAGFIFADVTEVFDTRFQIPKADIEPGTYRKITGNEALVMGFIAGANRCEIPIFYGSYPITPASDVLHYLSKYKNFGVTTFQAEDEIAAVGVAIGASFSGVLGMTGTSGPGLCLKGEALGLAVIAELPLVVINVQRGGPSTGLPTKTEQSDLLQAFYGRNGESPVMIVAAKSPSDCFEIALNAVKLSIKYMTPIIVLSDGYIANSSEPWKIPNINDFEKQPVKYRTDPENFFPYQRDEETLARPWVKPGTPDLEHRIGGLEKSDITGNVSYDPDNHQKMVNIRKEKINRAAQDVPLLEIFGENSGKVLVVGWGGTYGAITSAVEKLQTEGVNVSSIHIQYLNPFPKNLKKILDSFETILVPELNMGQLSVLLKDYAPQKNIQSFCKVKGRPFLILELEEKIKQTLKVKGQ